jgi:hypothetical protein
MKAGESRSKYFASGGGGCSSINKSVFNIDNEGHARTLNSYVETLKEPVRFQESMNTHFSLRSTAYSNLA